MSNDSETLRVYVGRVVTPYVPRVAQSSRTGELVARDVKGVLEFEERQAGCCFLYARDGRAVWPEMTLTCAKRLGPEITGERRMPRTVEMIKGLRKFGMQTIPTGMIIGLAEARNAIVSLVHGDDAATDKVELNVDIQGEIRPVPITWAPGVLKVPLLTTKAYLAAYELMEHAREGIVAVRDPHPVGNLMPELAMLGEECSPMAVGVELI